MSVPTIILLVHLAMPPKKAAKAAAKSALRPKGKRTEPMKVKAEEPEAPHSKKQYERNSEYVRRNLFRRVDIALKE